MKTTFEPTFNHSFKKKKLKKNSEGVIQGEISLRKLHCKGELFRYKQTHTHPVTLYKDNQAIINRAMDQLIWYRVHATPNSF